MTRYINISRSAYKTLDVTLGNLDDIEDVCQWFAMISIWGTSGYDRYHNNTLYYEIPEAFYDVIEECAFIRKYGIKVIKD